MDLELTDEQRWLSESVDTLLDREWLPPEAVAGASIQRRRRVWEQLIDFGALSVGGEDGIGAVEACLIARSLGSHLGAVPFIGSAAVRLALGGGRDAGLDETGPAIALALREPGSGWAIEEPSTTLRGDGDAFTLAGEKVAVEQPELADQLAVVTAIDSEPALVLVAVTADGVAVEPRESFDVTLPMAAARFADPHVAADAVLTGAPARETLSRLTTAGSLLVAAEAIGAAARILEEACRYAGERRQFGRRIAAFQSLRHLLADMYVRSASGWSTVLYAAAAFDEGADEAPQTASIAKAYVSRGAREIAHGAMQVFGGIAFTDEHAAHRFLRRIIVRERQFGDAAHHERALGENLARHGGRTLTASAGPGPR